VYNINGLLVVLGIVSISFSVLLAQPINTSENYKKNYRKAREWKLKNVDSTRFFANKALLVAQTSDEKAIIYSLLGEMAKTQEWSNSAIHYFQRALKLYTTEQAKNKARLALITPYRRQKKFNTALSLARWVKRYLEAKKDSANLKDNYSSLGNIFFNLSQVDTFSIKWTDSSIYYHQKAIAIHQNKFPGGLARKYYNVSFAFETISPDSAIYYTQLALDRSEISFYDRMLYNIRLAQINYRKGAYKAGNLNLDAAQKINYNDLNLRFMYALYRNLIAIHLKDIDLAKQYINQSDSLLALMASKTTNVVDRRGMSQIAADAYLDIYLSASKVFKQTQDSAYFTLANEYQIKKLQASRQYQQSNQLIVAKDSLVLADTDKQPKETSLTEAAERLQSGIVVLVLTFLLAGWGVWWWLRYTQQQGVEAETTKVEALVEVQGLNTNVLSTLASQQDYQQIYTLLDKHIGVEGLAAKENDLVPGESFTAEEKVYLVLKMEGFSDWEVCQMLDQTKRTIGDWNKRIRQKIKLPEKPE